MSKRSDGFHNIETIFYPVSLCDYISIENSDAFHFTCNDKLLENDTNNLITRAKNIIENRFNLKADLHIDLQKNIPIGAGLGGGSSNAAVILKALSIFYKLGLSEKELESIGLELGSDVPFFIKGQPVFAESRGELFKPIDLEIQKPILIVNPGIHISTRLAYENIKPKAPEFPLYNISHDNLNIECWKDKIFNDFEDFAFSAFPKVKDVKDKMYGLGAVFSLLSGSGSSVFGIFNNLDSAKKAESYFTGDYFTHISYPI
ncbi:MAG: 4-(cytidine 5'-diphospho)-2-C-methyl-D-erythritol kinase [Bacteroidota bacterium]|nr:4-(cytidine 5'-diphospho)-2-C-methyl-D-erythritol kinase [Bacteroidota bacterium]